MSDDGVVTGPHGAWGHALPDGTVTFPNGDLRGRLLDDGRVVDAEGVELATIAADGSAKANDIELRFDETGKLSGGDPDNSIQLIPPAAEAKRTAMLIFLLTQFEAD